VSCGIIGQLENVAQLTLPQLANPNVRFAPGHKSAGGGHGQPDSCV